MSDLIPGQTVTMQCDGDTYVATFLRYDLDPSDVLYACFLDQHTGQEWGVRCGGHAWQGSRRPAVSIVSVRGLGA